VQALVAECGYTNPKRSSTGYELNRLNMLLALLEKKIGIALNQYDVFVNIAGGIKISETAADLAVVAAILSSFKDRVLSSDTIFIGEISLTGDIRDVQNLDARLKEAQNHNFTKAIVPRSLKDRSIKIKCFEASEVSKIVDWM
jgi:DNA repair protein RadA/Sms